MNEQLNLFKTKKVKKNKIKLNKDESLSEQEIIKKALLKKALGYTSEEIVEEYASDGFGDGLKLLKRKVTSKDVPPDIPAVKTLLEVYKETNDFSDLTDDELICERDKLLNILKEKENIYDD